MMMDDWGLDDIIGIVAVRPDLDDPDVLVVHPVQGRAPDYRRTLLRSRPRAIVYLGPFEVHSIGGRFYYSLIGRIRKLSRPISTTPAVEDFALVFGAVEVVYDEGSGCLTAAAGGGVPVLGGQAAIMQGRRIFVHRPEYGEDER